MSIPALSVQSMQNEPVDETLAANSQEPCKTFARSCLWDSDLDQAELPDSEKQGIIVGVKNGLD